MLVDIEQGSDAWLKWRKSGIGGSDAATCLDLNPWSTRKALYDDKVNNIEAFQTAAMQRGKALESDARFAYEIMTGNNVTPACFQHDTISWMLASLDGVTPDHKFAVEIKCPNEITHKQSLSGLIPLYYKVQMTHCMIVMGIDRMDYFSYRPGYASAVLPYSLDKLLAEDLIEAEKLMMHCIQTKTPPQMDDTVNDFESERLVNLNWAMLEYKKLGEAIDIGKEWLKTHFGKNFKAKGIRLSEVEMPGRVDYESIPELKNIDLEKYRKPAKKVFKVTQYKTYE